MSPDTRLLRQHLAGRLAPRLAAEHPAAREPAAEERALDLLEGAVLAWVTELVPEPLLQQSVLDHPRVAQLWSLLPGPADGRPDQALLGALALSERRPGAEAAAHWLAEVTPGDLASLLRHVGDPDAERLAQAILDGSLFLGQELRGARSEPPAGLAPANDEGLRRALARWPLAACGLLVSVEKEARARLALETSALAAARFAFGLVAELTRDEPEAVSKRQVVILDALSKLPQEQLDGVAAGPGNPRLLERLDRELRLGIEEMRAEVGFSADPPTTELAAQALERGLLAWDERLARHLEKLGKEGARAAESVRQNAALRQRETPADRPGKLWALWADPNTAPAGCRFARLLVRVLWHERIHPLLRREHDKPPALLWSVANSLSLVTSTGLTLGRDEHGHPQLVRPHPTRPRTGATLAVADPPTMDAELLDVARGMKLMGGKLAWPFLEWLVETAHRQALQGASRPHLIEREGGWEAIVAEVLEVSSPASVHPEDRSNLRSLARMLSRTPIRWSDGVESSSLFLLDESAAAAGRGRGRSLVCFTPSHRLLEHEHFRARARHGSGAGPKQWSDWRLVPLVRPRVIPPLPGSPRATYGPQALFLRRLLLHFVERSQELRTYSGVQLSVEDARLLATFALLPERLVPALLAHLVSHRALEAFSGDRYAPADKATRDFICEGSKRSDDNSERGQHSARKRRSPPKT